MTGRTGVLGSLALTLSAGMGLVLAGPAHAEDAGTIFVPGDFVGALSDTRATGGYEVEGTGLHIWTQGNGGTDKVAEYVATDTPLAEVGTPSLSYQDTDLDLGDPGYQLVVDLDDDGDDDGILVGEAVYSGNWWLGGHRDFKAGAEIRAAAPKEPGGHLAENGSLQQWASAFPEAVVTAFGFSLGSGVLGNGVIESITFADTRYTFAVPVVLVSKEECKDGRWATSTHPVYRNQGACVSHFARSSRQSPAGGAGDGSAATASSITAATGSIGVARNPAILRKMI